MLLTALAGTLLLVCLLRPAALFNTSVEIELTEVATDIKVLEYGNVLNYLFELKLGEGGRVPYYVEFDLNDRGVSVMGFVKRPYVKRIVYKPNTPECRMTVEDLPIIDGNLYRWNDTIFPYMDTASFHFGPLSPPCDATIEIEFAAIVVDQQYARSDDYYWVTGGVKFTDIEDRSSEIIWIAQLAYNVSDSMPNYDETRPTMTPTDDSDLSVYREEQTKLVYNFQYPNSLTVLNGAALFASLENPLVGCICEITMGNPAFLPVIPGGMSLSNAEYMDSLEPVDILWGDESPFRIDMIRNKLVVKEVNFNYDIDVYFKFNRSAFLSDPVTKLRISDYDANDLIRKIILIEKADDLDESDYTFDDVVVRSASGTLKGSTIIVYRKYTFTNQAFGIDFATKFDFPPLALKALFPIFIALDGFTGCAPRLTVVGMSNSEVSSREFFTVYADSIKQEAGSNFIIGMALQVQQDTNFRVFLSPGNFVHIPIASYLNEIPGKNELLMFTSVTDAVEELFFEYETIGVNITVEFFEYGTFQDLYCDIELSHREFFSIRNIYITNGGFSLPYMRHLYHTFENDSLDMQLNDTNNDGLQEIASIQIKSLEVLKFLPFQFDIYDKRFTMHAMVKHENGTPTNATVLQVSVVCGINGSELLSNTHDLTFISDLKPEMNTILDKSQAFILLDDYDSSGKLRIVSGKPVPVKLNLHFQPFEFSPEAFTISSTDCWFYNFQIVGVGKNLLMNIKTVSKWSKRFKKVGPMQILLNTSNSGINHGAYKNYLDNVISLKVELMAAGACSIDLSSTTTAGSVLSFTTTNALPEISEVTFDVDTLQFQEVPVAFFPGSIATVLINVYPSSFAYNDLLTFNITCESSLAPINGKIREIGRHISIDNQTLDYSLNFNSMSIFLHNITHASRHEEGIADKVQVEIAFAIEDNVVPPTDLAFSILYEGEPKLTHNLQVIPNPSLVEAEVKFVQSNDTVISAYEVEVDYEFSLSTYASLRVEAISFGQSEGTNCFIHLKEIRLVDFGESIVQSIAPDVNSSLQECTEFTNSQLNYTFSRITNLGYSYRYGQNMQNEDHHEASLFTVKVILQFLDPDALLIGHNSTVFLNLGADGKSIGQYQHNITFDPLIPRAAELSVAGWFSENEIELNGEIDIEVSVEHTNTSTANAKDVELAVFLPKMLSTGSGTNIKTYNIPDLRLFNVMNYTIPVNFSSIPNAYKWYHLTVAVQASYTMLNKSASTPTVSTYRSASDIHTFSIKYHHINKGCMDSLGVSEYYDCQFSSSSNYDDSFTSSRAKLMDRSGWRSNTWGNGTQFLKIAFDKIYKVSYMRLREDNFDTLQLKYSLDGLVFADYEELGQKASIYRQDMIVTPMTGYNILEYSLSPFIAQFLIILVAHTSEKFASLRVELLGCNNTQTNLVPLSRDETCNLVGSINVLPEYSLRSIITDEWNRKLYVCDSRSQHGSVNRFCHFTSLSPNGKFRWTRLQSVTQILSISKATLAIYGLCAKDTKYCLSNDAGKTWHLIPVKNWWLVRDDAILQMKFAKPLPPDPDTANRTCYDEIQANHFYGDVNGVYQVVNEIETYIYNWKTF